MLCIGFSNAVESLTNIFSLCLEKDRQMGNSHLDRPQWVIVNGAQQDYLKFSLAKHMGVCANFHFEAHMFLLFSRLIEDALDKIRDPRHFLTKQMAFSVLYEMFCQKYEDRALAVSQANAAADNLMQYVYTGRFEDALSGKGVPSTRELALKQYGTAVCEACRNAGENLILPFEVFRSPQILNALELPEALFIFDPELLSPFEMSFIRVVSNQMPVFICAFSPCREFWEDIRCSAKDETVFYKNPDASFLIERCGKVSQLTGKSLSALVNYEDPLKLFEENGNVYSPEDGNVHNCALHKIQNDALNLKSTDGVQNDASIRFGIFDSIRDEVRHMANDIVEMFSNDTDDARLLFDDIAVLVPGNVAQQYAVCIHSEFEKRRIPHNIKSILHHPLNTCFLAFEAFVNFLSCDACRSDVLAWAFHEGVVDDESRDALDEFTLAIDRFGIYCGFRDHAQAYLKGNEAYTWHRGMARVCRGLTDARGASDTDMLDFSTAQLVLRHYHRIQSMLCDHEAIRSQRLLFGEWKNLIFAVFDAWIRQDAPYREQGFKMLMSTMNSGWPLDLNGERHPFDEILPLLRNVARHLVAVDNTQRFGGVQVRALDSFALSSQVTYFLGQTADNFPTRFSNVFSLSRISNADRDAHAWLKWVLNTKKLLRVSAVIGTTVPDNELSSHLHAPADDLARHAGVDLTQCRYRKGLLNDREAEHAQAFDCALGQIRRAYAVRDAKEPWPTSMHSFSDGTERRLMAALLNGAFGAPEDETLPPRDEATEAKPLYWWALADIFSLPRETYRRRCLRINESVANSSVWARAAAHDEPVEADGGMDARRLMDDLLLREIATGTWDLFAQHFETLQKEYVSKGKFPSGMYQEIMALRFRIGLSMACRNIRHNGAAEEGVLTFLSGNGRPVIYTLGGARYTRPALNAMFDGLRVENLDPVVEEKNGGRRAAVYGELPMIARIRTGGWKKIGALDGVDAFFISGDLKPSDRKMACRLQVALQILKYCGCRELPTHVACLSNGCPELYEIRDAFAGSLDAGGVLSRILNILYAGKHEIGSRALTTKNGRRIQLKQSALQKYSGDDGAIETESHAFWNAVDFDLLTLLDSGS